MKSFKCGQGLAMGVVVGGFGGGAFIFNQIQVPSFSKKIKKTKKNSSFNLAYIADCILESRQYLD